MNEIAKNREAFNRKLAQIRANQDLNEQAKRRMIEEAYDGAQARHQELFEEQRRKEAERIARLERSVMGIRYPMTATDADKELARMSYRDAYDRAEKAAAIEGVEGIYESREALAALLERAERSGDLHLADAVYHVAITRGIREVADSYLESRPTERQRWEDYSEARRAAESVDRVIFGTGDRGPMRPEELGGFAGGGGA